MCLQYICSYSTKYCISRNKIQPRFSETRMLGNVSFSNSYHDWACGGYKKEKLELDRPHAWENPKINVVCRSGIWHMKRKETKCSRMTGRRTVEAQLASANSINQEKKKTKKIIVVVNARSQYNVAAAWFCTDFLQKIYAEFCQTE